jgi:BlaI family transcriptional regulator, penicillinase repressor
MGSDGMGATDPTLSRREREVLDILFRRGDATVAEVMDEMEDPPSYSAVRSVLRILKEKGHIVHREDGPRYVYAPSQRRDRARRAALDHLVDTFFDGSAELAVAALLRRSDLQLSESQIQRLAGEIGRAGQEGR